MFNSYLCQGMNIIKSLKFTGKKLLQKQAKTIFQKHEYVFHIVQNLVLANFDTIVELCISTCTTTGLAFGVECTIGTISPICFTVAWRLDMFVGGGVLNTELCGRFSSGASEGTVNGISAPGKY